MDYDKMSPEELFEEFKKQYYKTTEIAKGKNALDINLVHDELISIRKNITEFPELYDKNNPFINNIELETYASRREVLPKDVKELRKFLEVSDKLDNILPITDNGFTFTDNFILEHNTFGYFKTNTEDWKKYGTNIPDDISRINDQEILDSLDIETPEGLESQFPDKQKEAQEEADRLISEAEGDLLDPPDELLDTPTNVVDDINEITLNVIQNNRDKVEHQKIIDALLEKYDEDIVGKYFNNLIAEQEKINPEYSGITLQEFEQIRSNELLDGDSMTEQSLSEIEDEIGSIDEEELLNEIDDVGDNSLTGIDPDVEIPDTVPEDLVNEVDKADFDEFKNLIEPSDAVVESVEDIAESIVDNASSQLTPDEVDSFANIAEQYKMQGDKLINNIPDQVVKKRIKNKMTELTTRLLTPGGVVDYLDFYETAVFALGTVIAAAPELKNIANWYAGSMTNTLFKAYGMPGIKVEQYEPNWERIGKVFDQVEKVTPTDILIKKVMDTEPTNTNYISPYLNTGQVKNKDVSESLTNTLSFMANNTGKGNNQPDKLKEAFIYGNKK